MDILAIASTPIPAYFTVGPLAVLFILLVVLVARKGQGQDQVAPTTNQGTAPVAPSPSISAAMQPAQSQVVAEPVSAQPQVSDPVAVSAPAPVSEPAPAPAPAPVPVPPISSWKPAAPATMDVPESVTQVAQTAPEVQPQVTAPAPQVLAQESVVSPVTETTPSVPVAPTA
jgi:hypothetical protein